MSSYVLASVTETNSLQAGSGTYVIYAKIEGVSSGVVTGDVVAKGHEGEILVIGYSHLISANYDPVTGSLTGKITHYPFKITIEQGRASPVLLKMLTTGESVASAVINFYKYDSSGILTNYYRITLEKGRVTQYSGFGTANGYFETYAFIYQKITWYDIASGIQSQADLVTRE